MASNSKIEWTTHTFNPWRGCTKVSAGCANCYAETLSKRFPGNLGVWGANGTRVVAAESYWREPLKWDRAAAKAGERHRVFCASLADVFEDWRGAMLDTNGKPPFTKEYAPTLTTDRYVEMSDVRARLFRLIDATPNLDWLLLTKRPENISRMTPGLIVRAASDMSAAALESGASSEEVPFVRPNVWLGTSVENQEQADARIPHLLKCPAAVRFLSVEPMLGPINLTVRFDSGGGVMHNMNCLRGYGGWGDLDRSKYQVHWVIVGGESGHGARPCSTDWIRSIVSQCGAAGVPCFVKQLGAKPVAWDHGSGDEFTPDAPGYSQVGYRGKPLSDKKGGDMAEWPEDLRVREMPSPRPASAK